MRNNQEGERKRMRMKEKMFLLKEKAKMIHANGGPKKELNKRVNRGSETDKL